MLALSPKNSTLIALFFTILACVLNAAPAYSAELNATPQYQQAGGDDGMRPSMPLLLRSLNQALVSNFKTLPIDWTAINSTREAKLAFSISYSNGNDVHMNTVFFQSREIGSDCHACKPDLGALVFQGVGNSITLHSAQTSFTTTGTWGDTVKSDREIMISSKNGVVTLLVEDSYMLGGEQSIYENILIYDSHAWFDAGTITISFGNGAHYNDSDQYKAYGYDGAAKFVDANTNFFDILVARSGNICLSHREGDCSLKRKADSCYFKFNGSGYVITQGTECELMTDGINLEGIATGAVEHTSQLPSPQIGEPAPSANADKAILRIYRFM